MRTGTILQHSWFWPLTHLDAKRLTPVEAPVHIGYDTQASGLSPDRSGLHP